MTKGKSQNRLYLFPIATTSVKQENMKISCRTNTSQSEGLRQTSLEEYINYSEKLNEKESA
jgi:hypothetical protein